jgi:sortase (surface protein transpeptidase)
MAIVGGAMIVISAYYLYAYARSGSDAEQFNVAAAAPADHLALLGQAMPEPRPRAIEAVAIDADGLSSESADAVEAAIDASRRGVDVDRADTVSIMSVLPGARFAVSEEKGDRRSHRVDEDIAEEFSEDVSVRIATPRGDNEGTVPSEVPKTAAVSAQDLIDTFASIYPGGSMNPRYWSDPYWAGNLPFGVPGMPEGFVPIDAEASVHAETSGEPGRRMRIPAIDLDATVSELELKDLGDSRAWSTPDKVVGHIPTTARPGEAANGWYFGHLEDFLSNEGDIFRRLPEIAQMIKNDPVDIFITTSEAEYMYRVTRTKQLHRRDLQLTDTSNAQISLVTCWPFRVYDQRIVVSATLIAIKPFQET